MKSREHRGKPTELYLFLSQNMHSYHLVSVPSRRLKKEFDMEPHQSSGIKNYLFKIGKQQVINKLKNKTKKCLKY